MSRPSIDWTWLTGTTPRRLAGPKVSASGKGSGTAPQSSRSGDSGESTSAMAPAVRCFQMCGLSLKNRTSARWE